MEVFRITKSEYAASLYASGKANRWNFADEKVIYTACSRSLVCLENVVHSSGEALQEIFMVTVIFIPDELSVEIVHMSQLPEDWYKVSRHPTCQNIGSQWLEDKTSPILKVPSAIIHEESNYVLNEVHPDYAKIQTIRSKNLRLIIG